MKDLGEMDMPREKVIDKYVVTCCMCTVLIVITVFANCPEHLNIL